MNGAGGLTSTAPHPRASSGVCHHLLGHLQLQQGPGDLYFPLGHLLILSCLKLMAGKEKVNIMNLLYGLSLRENEVSCRKMWEIGFLKYTDVVS